MSQQPPQSGSPQHDVIAIVRARLAKNRTILKRSKDLDEKKRIEIEAQVEADKTWIKVQAPEKESLDTAIEPYPVCDPDPTALDELRTIVRRVLFLPDPYMVDIVCGTICANGFTTEPPVWVVFVEPPSQGKSDILGALLGMREAYLLGRVTGATFRCAYRAPEDEEAAPRMLDLLDKRVVIWPEFTNVITMPERDQQRVLTDLRDIYDGKAKISSGSGVNETWTGRFGLIAGCTGRFDRAQFIRQELGERFIVYRPTLPAPEEMRLKIKHTRAWPSNAKKESIARGFTAWRDKIGLVPALQEIALDDDQYDVVSLLATMTAEARTAVDHNAKDDPDPEGPGRLIKQFHALAAGVAVANGRRGVTDHEINVVRRVAQSTMPTSRRRFLRALVEQPDGAKVNATWKAMAGAGKQTLYRVKDDLIALGILQEDRFALTPRWRDLIARTGLFAVASERRVLRQSGEALVEGEERAVDAYLRVAAKRRGNK